MSTVTLYGHSDDLIELDGDLQEELCSGEGVVGFSDGTVLRVVYSNGGVWRIILVRQGTAELTIVPAPEDDDDNYSDRATLVGDITWAIFGEQGVVA